MLFNYKGFDTLGNVTKGSIDAKTLDEAKQKLKNNGIFYQEIAEQLPGIRELSGLFHTSAIPSKKLSSLSRDLSIYLHSGVTIVNAIKLASTQHQDDVRLKRFLEAVSTMLNEGKSFYTSLESQNIYTLPEFYIQSILVSENGGMLEEVLAQMAVYLKEQERLIKQIKGALTYPSFIIVVSIVMIAFMLTVVVPKISTIFESMGQDLPGITTAVVVSGTFLSQFWLVIMIALLVTVIAFTHGMRTNQEFRHTIHRYLLSLPFFGKIIEYFELSRFSYIISILIRSGVPFVQAVKLSANTLNNSVLKEIFISSSDRVVEGEKLSNALRKASYSITPSFIEAVALGEETSEIAKIMENLSELYFEENKDKITYALSLLEPSMMLFVGASIGVIVIAMLLPIFLMNIQ